MCGICGGLSSAGFDRDQLERMARAIAHRGPDDEGLHIDGGLALASCRLSIIDLESGHQPLANEDGSVWIVFNGEIYNYRVLREELERQGHVFRTNSDTEVIVHLYEEHGERCVERLEGMFAVALWDAKAEKLFLARDPLGQKPLFYARSSEGFLFGSEIKSIVASDRVAIELDVEALHHYLSLRFVPHARTMFKRISKVPPGHWLVLHEGSVRIQRYWGLDFRSKLKATERELLEILDEHLVRTVKAHMISDVPVGAMLSGGMDSSTIVALMAEAGGSDFSTFAIGVEDQSFNELPFARLVAEDCGTHHIEESVESNLIALLPQMIFHLDEPSDPIAACMYHAAELASQHVKVALGGDGGDELFAGFDRYLGVGQMERFQGLPLLMARAILGPLVAVLPERFSYKSSSQKLRWLNRLARAPNTARRYAEATLISRFSHDQKGQLFDDRLWNELKDLESAEVIVAAFENAPADDVVDRMLYTDYVTRLPEHSLMLVDRMSMAHSVEIRSPLVDHNLVTLLAKYPSSMKIRRGTLKYALRRVAAGRLPRTILNRPKQGFMFPIASWFAGDLYDFVRDFLTQSTSVEEGIFKRPAILRLLEDHRSRKVDNHVRLWMLVNVEIWRRMYVGGESAGDISAEMSERIKASAVRS